MDDPLNLSTLPVTLSAGIGAFLACAAAWRQYAQGQRNEVTQVTILTEDRDLWKDRAEKMTARFDEMQERLNEIMVSQAEMKAQNTALIEQVATLRQENSELRAEVRQLSGVRNDRAS